jgi:GH15 family glucan-1,4-alpha-glucosidase
MCAPRFDSASVFAAVLDDERGGRFQLAPLLEGARQKQLYLPDTCVLLTRFFSDDGVAEVSDFMPIDERRQAHDVVRRAKTVRGEVRFRMVCQPRFDYARATHTAELTGDGARFIARSGPPLALLLRSSIPVRIDDGAAVADFTLRADESASFVLEQVESGGESPSGSTDYVSQAFKDTANFWRGWVGRSTYRGRWREMVNARP